jgi:hypothetical protein
MSGDEMVKQFQCPGCVCGSDPKTCDRYAPEPILWGIATGTHCVNHVIGTRVNFQPFALGLPKGFCRPGMNLETKEPTTAMLIRLWPESTPKWDKFNVPAWAMFHDGHTFVRTYSPRTNTTALDVLPGDRLATVAPLYDAATFLDEMD